MPSSLGTAQSKGFPGCFNLKLWETLFPFFVSTSKVWVKRLVRT